MPKLPDLAQLGARQAPQNRQGIARQDTTAAGMGLAQFGNAIGQFGEELNKVEMAKQRATAGLVLAKTTNDLHGLHDELTRGISDGSVPTDKADALFTERLEAIRGKALEGLTENQKRIIGTTLESTTGGLKRSLAGVVFKRNQSDIASTIDQFGEQAQRDVSRIGPANAADKYGAFVDFNGSSAGLNPAQQQKLKQGFTERAYYTHFDALGTQALTQGNVQALKELRAQIGGKDGEPIDPQRRTQLTHQLFGYEQSILAKQAAAANAAEREALARENNAIELSNKTIDLLANGNALSPDFIRQITTESVGTSVEPVIALLLSGQTPVAGFATRPAAERAAILERGRNEAADPAKGTNPQQAAMLKQLTTINDNLVSKAKDNVWATAQGAGVIKDAPAVDATNINTVLDAVSGRMGMIGKVEAWAGGPVTPLQPQEAQQLAETVKKLPPRDASEFLGELGARLGTPQRISAVAAQFAHNNKPLELSMKLNDRTTAGRTVGELVLLGAQSLSDKTVKRDDAALSGWRSEIAGMVRGTLGSQAAENDAIEAAYYVRASMDNPATATPGMSLRASNENAVSMVIGKPIERGGVKTILPRGMTEDAFTDKLRQYTPEALSSIAPSGVVYVRGQPRKLEQLSSALPGMGMRRNPAGGYTPVSGGAFVTLDEAGTIPLNLPVQ